MSGTECTYVLLGSSLFTLDNSYVQNSSQRGITTVLDVCEYTQQSAFRHSKHDIATSCCVTIFNLFDSVTTV